MERVIYKKSPLLEVIAQFVFPPILLINNTEPTNFQEAIRAEYPFYGVKKEQHREITINPENSEDTPIIKEGEPTNNYEFISTNGTYKINLTSSFISISTLNYTRWEKMNEQIEKAINALVPNYNPAFFNRVGLRYIDAYSKKKYALEDKKWNELLSQKWLSGVLTEDEDKIINYNCDTEYYLEDGVSVAKIRTGLGVVNNDPAFIIDSDFIHGRRISIEEYKAKIDYLHNEAKKFVGSVVLKPLHEAMEPEKI